MHVSLGRSPYSNFILMFYFYERNTWLLKRSDSDVLKIIQSALELLPPLGKMAKKDYENMPLWLTSLSSHWKFGKNLTFNLRYLFFGNKNPYRVIIIDIYCLMRLENTETTAQYTISPGLPRSYLLFYGSQPTGFQWHSSQGSCMAISKAWLYDLWSICV